MFGAVGADPRILASAEAALKIKLPDDYRDILLASDGGEGWVGDHYLVLWKAEELEAFNREYEVAQYAPGLIAFGGDGGGEAFAFDTRSDPYPVVMAPFIGMSLTDALVVASSVTGLLKRMRSENSLFS